MIIFELICDKAHEFEAWFRDHLAFQSQMEQGLIQCPICGSCEVTQRLSTGGWIRNKQTERSPEKERGLLETLREFVEAHFEDVGPDFAKKALKMHYGVDEPRNIRGTSTEAEEKVLREEGIDFHKIPLALGESKLN